MSLDHMSLGRMIKACRENKNYSQVDLGMEIGVSAIHLSRIENGSRTPSLDMLILIANALDVTPDVLLSASLKTVPPSHELEVFFQSVSKKDKQTILHLLFLVEELLS